MKRAVKSDPQVLSLDGAAPLTLTVDVGGSGVKAAVLDVNGRVLTERSRVETPQPCNPQLLLDAISRVIAPLPPFDRISVGFPGVVRHGVVLTAPNLGTDAFRGFDLAKELRDALGKPACVINDADLQGFGAIDGKGVEMVITLGTGFGTALFVDGRLAPHLEISHHPFRKGETYDEQLGNAARKRVGNRKWNKRVIRAINNLHSLVHFDRLWIGGGNAKKIRFELPPEIALVDNSSAILGGIRLWQEADRDD